MLVHAVPMMVIQAVFVVIIVCMQYYSADAIECYTCTNSSRLIDCTTITKCPMDSGCSSEYTTLQNGTRYYSLGCKNVMSCPLDATGPSAVIGRALAGHAHNCSECCHTSNCNRQLCQDSGSRCTDDVSYDCARFGALTNICDDMSHIKPFCRRFCGFCNTEDGGWSHWSPWTSCDVTCGNGTRAKTRTCSDPPPTNGGSDCVGLTKEEEPCSNDPCPIHGGWSRWSGWGGCSASCDLGLQRRDRTCSDPHPALYGDHCYGDSHEDRLCLPGACADGNWSDWGVWSTCDHGSGGCGLRTRSRRCDNPAPSLAGRYCDGETSQTGPCDDNASQGPVVFYAASLSTYSPGIYSSLVFRYAATNLGNGYDSSTGLFTAPSNGTYAFNVQLYGFDNELVGVGLYINGVRYHSLLTSDHRGIARSFSAFAYLTQGEYVNVRTDANTAHGQVFQGSSSRINSFSGALM